jgi:hypothetical protein
MQTMITLEGSHLRFPFEQPARTPGRHVSALQFDPVRPKLYAVGTGGGAMYLNLKSGDTGQIHRIYAHGHLKGERLVSMAVSPDGRLLVTGDLEGRLVLWNLELNCLAKKLKHATRATSLAFSPDNAQLMAAAETRELRLWTLPDYDYGLRDARGAGSQEATFGPGGELVERVGSAEQARVRVRDAKTGEVITEQELGHVEIVMAQGAPYVVVLPLMQRRQVQVYALPSLELVRTIEAPRDLLDVAAISGPSAMVAVAAGVQRRSRRLERVEVFDLHTGAHVASWRPASENVARVAISADGAWLATADENGMLHAQPTGEALIAFPAEPAERKKTRAKKVKKVEAPTWDWTPGLPPGVVLSQIQRHHADAMKRARATKNTRTVVPSRKKAAAQQPKRRVGRVTEPLNLPDRVQALLEPELEPVVVLEAAPQAVEGVVKRKPGRPRKNPLPETAEAAAPVAAAATRGRVATPVVIPRISLPEPVLEPMASMVVPVAAMAPGASALAPGGVVVRRRKVDPDKPVAAPEPPSKSYTVEALDALLDAEPSHDVWFKLMELMEGWPNTGDLMQDLVPHAMAKLDERWPDNLRHAPPHLLSRLEVPAVAAIVSLARTLVWHKAPQNAFFGAVGHPALGQVTYVDLSHWQITESLQIRRALEAICGTRHLSHMRVLRLRGCNLDDIEPLTTAAPFDALHVLDLSHNALSLDVMRQIGQITAMRSLRELDLSYCDLDTKNCKPLADWTNFGRLERLLLDGNQLSITGGMVLGRAEGFGSLRYLSLKGNAVGHNGMSAIARGAMMTTVQILDLTGNNLGAEGVRALLRSRKVTGFYKLILADNNLDDEAAQIILDSGKRDKFEHLDVSNNPKISPAMLAKLNV